MDKISLLLSGLMCLAIVIMLAPNVIAMNRGKTLRNIALWVAIFLGLALVYKTLGIEKSGKGFFSPPSQSAGQDSADELDEENNRSTVPSVPAPSPADDQNYSPPQE